MPDQTKKRSLASQVICPFLSLGVFFFSPLSFPTSMVWQCTTNPLA